MMAMPTLGKAARPLLAAVVLSLALHPHRTEGQTTPTVVEVYETPRGVAYRIDSRPADRTAETSLLRLLSLVYEKHGADAPVVVLLDPGVPISQISNVDGTAGKAQLNNLRYFVIDRGTQKMTEIKWGPTVPYSRNPPPDPDPLKLFPEKR
jgi:hypothetical protein